MEFQADPPPDMRGLLTLLAQQAEPSGREPR
jgi:hypothetical protein